MKDINVMISQRCVFPFNIKILIAEMGKSSGVTRRSHPNTREAFCQSSIVEHELFADFSTGTSIKADRVAVNMVARREGPCSS